MGYKPSVTASVMKTSGRKTTPGADCQGRKHSYCHLFNGDEDKGLKFWGANTEHGEHGNDHFQHHTNERKCEIHTGAYLVMIGLIEIYREIKVSFQMNTKPLWEEI